MSAECDGVLERVYAVLDGEVSQAEVAAIHEHLEACAPCLEEYEVQAALKALVRRCCVEQAPAQLRARIVESITRVTTVTTTTAVGAATATSSARSTTTATDLGDGLRMVTRTTRVTSREG